MFSCLGSVASSDMVAHFGGESNGLDGSKLPAKSSSRAAHWTALIIQTHWLILEVNLNIWISCIVCMCLFHQRVFVGSVLQVTLSTYNILAQLETSGTILQQSYGSFALLKNKLFLLLISM